METFHAFVNRVRSSSKDLQRMSTQKIEQGEEQVISFKGPSKPSSCWWVQLQFATFNVTVMGSSCYVSATRVLTHSHFILHLCFLCLTLPYCHMPSCHTCPSTVSPLPALPAFKNLIFARAIMMMTRRSRRMRKRMQAENCCHGFTLS